MPDQGGSGIDLFGSGEGYRPGRNTYYVDGMPATESQFMAIIDSGWIGGAFGLVEMAARMSATRYRVLDVWGQGKFTVYGSGQDDIATLKKTCIRLKQ